MAKNYFHNSLSHVLIELQRIGLLIKFHALKARLMQKVENEYQGVYISDKEIDYLLGQSRQKTLKQQIGMPQWATSQIPPNLENYPKAISKLTKRITRFKSESIKQGVDLRLDRLVKHFQLDAFDLDVLLVCLVPEFDLAFERIYAYLQDHVYKRRPAIDLVLNLLVTNFKEKLIERKRFISRHPLLKYHIVGLFEDQAYPNPSLLSKYLKVDERIVSYLLECDEVDARLSSSINLISPETSFQDLILSSDLKHRLQITSKEKNCKNEGLLFYFQGPYGVGKQSTASAICMDLEKRLLVVDINSLVNSDEISFKTAIRLIEREAILQNALIYLKGCDSLQTDDKRQLFDFLILEMENQKQITFLSGEKFWEPSGILKKAPFFRIKFCIPTFTERVDLWGRSLNGNNQVLDKIDLISLANNFRFSGGQIRDVVATAQNFALWSSPGNGNGHITKKDLYIGCQSQSNQKLGSLSQKIKPQYTWCDIILPEDQMTQLKEITGFVKCKHVVLDEWGFGRKLSLGKGLTVLFSGPSGTGKTMSAEVIANELNLDLYKIDLSTVVSKYIGETEKNLSQIFTEAETSNAILFFDEADALFGKRSEVKDAHDRYANIEIGYLLQKMEEYEGITILSTNLRKNMDEAFVRRMQFIIELPFPDEENRYLIWKTIFPSEVPINKNVDFRFLAKKLKFTGGNIKNTSLKAAYIAAEEWGTVNMENLIYASKREMQKMGKLSIDRDLGDSDNVW